MPNRSLPNILLTKKVESWALWPLRLAKRAPGPGVPFSGKKRDLDQEELGRGIGLCAASSYNDKIGTCGFLSSMRFRGYKCFVKWVKLTSPISKSQYQWYINLIMSGACIIFDLGASNAYQAVL